MTDDFEIRGADDFLRLSKALKAAGKTELRKELHRELKKAAKPLVKDARDEAAKVFPKRGGLNRWVARNTKFVVQIHTGATAGIRIGAPRKNVTAFLTNRDGFFRHPVHGRWDPSKTPKENRRSWKWVRQQNVPQGWFDRRMADEARDVRPAIQQALQNVADKVVREAG